MDDWVCVYSGNPLAARSLAAVLDRAGLRVFERLDAGFAVDVHARPGVTRVLVPPEDGERAERLTTHWQTHQTGRVNGLTGRLARVFGLSLLAPATWWGVALALPDRAAPPGPEAIGAVWLAAFVVLAQLESRRHRRERIELDGPPA